MRKDNTVTTRRFATFTAASIALFTATAAFGHPGHSGGGLPQGIAHPFSGLDHILAMIAVGLLAVQIGGRALWALPLTFVGAMIAGSALGIAGVPVPGVEHGIVASVLILGGMVALAVRPPLMATFIVVALAALFHGHAHGAEATAGSSLAYVAGFAAATAALHAIGISLALLPSRARLSAPAAIRAAGLLIALGGLYLCIA